MRFYSPREREGEKEAKRRRRMVFIKSAKGRFGWGHHPYTQDTTISTTNWTSDRRNSRHVFRPLFNMVFASQSIRLGRQKFAPL